MVLNKEKKRGKKRGVFFQHYNTTQKRTPPLKRRNTKKHIDKSTRARDRSLALQ